MRPVDRGLVPEYENGNPKEYLDYRQAKQDLIQRLGEYCSYCEMQLNASLHVEHIKPKSHHPALETKWENFLLACTFCNSTKGSKNINIEDYYWPDHDNTFLYLEYREGGAIRPGSDLSPGEESKAKNTIRLTGLDKIPKNHQYDNDPRWKKRRETWDLARLLQKRLIQMNLSEIRDDIIIIARSIGFWSIWMSVFCEDVDMRQRLIKAFPGTSKNCFDVDCKPINNHH